ncbi:vanillate O-demethylase ferredoxin subunit [Paraburkholderia sp. BL6665CI2N2]|uniref:PDR/VanB family oxidoreductase n=1 Tax=Paraburkholderia sp. BL6665CI2N2 TaxID=1938806 RepID=UPI001064633A|nr:PDR/VanB family oxidoreductase [Paraburkholderia sp. BL6665CI2N2]TDY15500.1 vanillate O-demethylase ferredoxin subunit [Paraburkholderia sp. BL6665CI2N2]
MKVNVIARREVATDICVLDLSHPEGKALPPFSAGAHIDVQLRDGLVRQYSLCNPPSETHIYRIGVLRDPNSRGGSIAMHALAEGDTVEIGEPRNHFPLTYDAGHSILLAGGIGITPILCMAEQLLNVGTSFEMHYGTREPSRTAFRDRLSEPDIRSYVHMYHDCAPASERLDLKRILSFPKATTHLYVCGPAGFIDAVLNETAARGWNPANVHREYFGVGAVAKQVNSCFQVRLASTGKLIEIAAHETVVQALASQGVDIPTSCEQGVCGTCLTRVLAGQPDHRDMYLTDEERAANDQFLPCCSRSRSPTLTLGL